MFACNCYTSLHLLHEQPAATKGKHSHERDPAAGHLIELLNGWLAAEELKVLTRSISQADCCTPS